MPDLRVLARLAELQAGHVSNTQLARLGLSRGAIAHLVRIGRLVSVDIGVHRVAGVPSTWDGHVVAAALRFPSAPVSHWSAAALLGLVPPRSLSQVDVLVTRRGRELQSRAVLVHSTRRPLDRLDLAWVDRLDKETVALAGLPAGVHAVRRVRVTSAVRTILDLSASCTAHELGSLIDEAMSKRLVSDSFLRRRLATHRGRGVGRVRLVDEVLLDAGGHSWLERRFLRLVREAGLPRPSCQVVHRIDGKFVARVDFEFAPAPVIVEVSGRRGHVSEADRARDARRRNELQKQGFLVLEFVTADVIDRAGSVISDIRATLSDLGQALPRHRA